MRRLALSACVAVLTIAAWGCGSPQNDVTITPRTSPEEIAEVSGYNGVHSGEVEGFFIIQSTTAEERVRFRLTGAFKKWGEENPPPFYLTLQSQGLLSGSSYIDFDASLYLQPSQALLLYGPAYKEQPYKPDASAFEEFLDKFEEAQAEEGEGNLGACPEAMGTQRFTDFGEKLAIKGSRKEDDGTPVIVVNGDLDVVGLMDLVGRLAEDPNCGAQIEAVGLPSGKGVKAAAAELQRGLMKSKLTLAVDRRGVLREVRAEVEYRNARNQRYEIELIFVMQNVNQKVEVVIPPKGRPLAKLLEILGTSLHAARQANGREAVLGFLEALGRGMAGRFPSAYSAQPRGD